MGMRHSYNGARSFSSDTMQRFSLLWLPTDLARYPQTLFLPSSMFDLGDESGGPSALSGYILRGGVSENSPTPLARSLSLGAGEEIPFLTAYTAIGVEHKSRVTLVK